MSTEFRIEFTITRCRDDEDDFVEIGFGSSGVWCDVDQCASVVNTLVQNRAWETDPGMPDPTEVDARADGEQ